MTDDRISSKTKHMYPTFSIIPVASDIAADNAGIIVTLQWFLLRYSTHDNMKYYLVAG